MIDIRRYHADTTLRKKTLQTIFERRKVSRGELTEILGLSLTSITKFVGALMADGIVMECGTLDSTGGRKTTLLGIRPDYAYILGIDIGGYAAKIGVVRMDGTLVQEWFIRPQQEGVPVKNITPQELRDFIRQIFQTYDPDRFMAVCAGVSGMVDYDAGKVIFCPNIAGWNDVPLRGLFEEAFGLPVFVDTSARCMALAEQHYGAGAGAAHQLLVSLGNCDIAAALIMDHKLYRGGNGFAGEFGHVMSSDKGMRCTCGNYDCLELSATLAMITHKIVQGIGNVQGYSPLLQLLPSGWNRGMLTPALIQKAIESGDKLCYEAVMTAGKHTGIALANLLNVINPNVAILGGSVIEFFPVILDTIRSVVRERVLVPVQQNLEIRKAHMDWRGAIVGSAVMALTEFFK